MKRALIYIIMCAASWTGALAQGVHYVQEDSLKVEYLLRNAPADATPMHFVRQLIGLPYVGHTLEVDADAEPLVVNLRQMDCTTLVEVVGALYKTHQAGTLTPWRTFCQQLERLRYWHGERHGYLSRLHYFTWWWHDNVRKKLVEEVKLEACGVRLTPLAVRINYMSQNPDKYRQLKAHGDWANALKVMENEYSVADGTYLSREELRRVGSRALRNHIQDGDIIAIVTQKPGLDYSHLGFASWQADGRLHLLNASSIHKRVVDEPKTLWQYLNEHPSSIGIRVFRFTKD